MRKSNTGFYYLEILITLLLSQWVVSGLLLTQVKMLRVSSNAHYRAIAINVGEIIVERLKVNQVIDESVMKALHEYLQNSLPEGNFELTKFNEFVTVEIYWDGFNHQSCISNMKGEGGCYHMEVVLK